MRRSALTKVLSVVTLASVLAAAWMFIELQWALRQKGSAETARVLAERDRNADVRDLVEQARSAREAAELAVRDLREQLAQARSEKEAAEAAVRETREQLNQERTAREAAERAIKDRRDRLAQQHTATEERRSLNHLGPLFDQLYLLLR
jgi:chromosome segregation ATPase